MDKGFGDDYTYASCSAVNVVTSAVDCNGCNGHGTCVKVSQANLESAILQTGLSGHRDDLFITYHDVCFSIVQMLAVK